MGQNILEVQTIFKILCNKNRIALIQRLAQKDRYVDDLAKCINIRSSKVSKQIAYLKKLGYVSGRKSGLRTYYHLENKSLPGLIKYVENSTLFYKRSS
jgi:predicted transcriptional regulator